MKSSILKSFFNKCIRGHLLNENWYIKNNILYLKSEIETELLRGVCFNSSGFSATQFEVIAFIQPLYIPCSYIFLTFSKGIRTLDKKQWWTYDEEQKEQQGKDLADYINSVEKDFLSKITDAKSFYDFYRKDRKVSVSHFQAVAYSACNANLNESKTEIIDFLSFIRKNENMNQKFIEELYHQSETLLQILNTGGDPHELMTEWILQTKTALKL